MDALTFPLSNRLMVLTAPHAASTLMLELAARLSLTGELRVLEQLQKDVDEWWSWIDRYLVYQENLEI